MPAGSKEVIASAYFASDDVIYAVKDRNASDVKVVDRVPSSNDDGSVAAAKKMEVDLKAAAIAIAKHLGDAELVAVLLICPGPFRTIAKTSPHYGEVGHNADVKSWRGDKNAIDIFRWHLKNIIGDVADKVFVRIYNQAGATAVGEFLYKYSDYILATATRSEAFKNLGNHLFLVADFTIDAALIVEGEPFHGLSTMNFGHHAVLPIEEDAEYIGQLMCDAHPHRPCLNGLASLPAIARRWPDLQSDNFIKCRDDEKITRIAFYIAQMIANVTLTTTPAKVVVGGRIAQNPLFVGYLREHVEFLLRDHENTDETYPGYPEMQDMENFIVPQSDRDSGVRGGLHVLSRILTKELDENNIASFAAYKKGLYSL